MTMNVPPSSPGNTELLLHLSAFNDEHEKTWNRKNLIDEILR